MMMTGVGALAATLPLPEARALPASPPAVPPPTAQTTPYLFHDEFDGPAGSAPDASKWMVATARETIRNPVFWDRPENIGQYRDDRQHGALRCGPRQKGLGHRLVRPVRLPDVGYGIAWHEREGFFRQLVRSDGSVCSG
ncbi:MAG: beta-glucanase/beta-glucan synthetase [Mycobacterium sp.]|jgi:hypothetical protein|nr:beta-glucanase/beta-glucan synthetase [Mycobacterium sp.]MDT5216499.1 hypothetical protein [Mycobacterium sp.]MDT5250747.1 hypothetical protein [Mycobacterium sp.]